MRYRYCMKKIIVANWKMHGLSAMALPLIEAALVQAKQCSAHAEVILCPPATLIAQLAQRLSGTIVKIGGQDCHKELQGAFTGDISASMLVDAGCSHVIIGHSERRQHYGESSATVAQKATAAINAGLIPIICVGETLDERTSGQAETTVGQQIKESVPKDVQFGKIILAYEPVWAIGSGKIPSTDDIRQMHGFIHSVVSGPTCVLYGGSVKSDNAASIMAIEGVSGVLVGGASLKTEEFCEIIRCSA
jgi:triosephosphate isomerase (TIM)